MKISYEWLKRYIDIPYTPDELADKLTMAGIEVEAIIQADSIPDGVIVGEILERNPHPDADKLSVCLVSDGKENLQVVCGAPNCDAGKKVPLATIGTIFPGGKGEKDFKIKKGKLRGVESFGMLCSGKELGLDNDHNGLMILSDSSKTGAPLSEIIVSDTVYEVEITPNRPDWLSHWGVARDIAALTGNKLKFPEINVPSAQIDSTIDTAELVKVEDSELCPRYTGRIIRGVTIKESPDWLKQCLVSIGLRPINNVVDITNFILHELGHPLHAFDLALLSGKRIVVRRATNGEKIITLDGDEHELTSNNLVICDAEKPVALAGVMGGEHSGVTEKTTDILLESAIFQTSNVRATSRTLGISSDSSYRFERGVDWTMAETASDRATQLILELAGGELVTDLVDVKATQPYRPDVKCRFNRIRSLLGCGVSNEEITTIFKNLGLKVGDINEENCVVTPPLFRHDIEREADLAEEIARIHGLDSIPAVPVAAVSGGTHEDDAYLPLQKLRDELIGLGLDECMTYSMTSQKSALRDSRFTNNDLIEIGNPLSHELAFMRPSLYGGMWSSVEFNIARGNRSLALFEVGSVFCSNPDLFDEERIEAVIALTGKRHPERFSEELKTNYDFYDLKGLLEELFEKRKISDVSFHQANESMFVKGAQAEIRLGDKVIGVFGEVADIKEMRIDAPLFMAVLHLDPILKRHGAKLLYSPISSFPSTTRDVAFAAPESLEHSAIVDFIQKLNLKNLENIELFDIFRGESVVAGHKSMAYSLTFRNAERTLTDKEVNKAYEFLRKKLPELGVELR